MESENFVDPQPTHARSEAAAVSALVNSQTPVPLRILIPKELIGAVMGPRKITVKQFTNETETKIYYDSKREGINRNPMDIGLVIQGKPNNCSIACHKIVEIIQARQNILHKNRPVKLKILMPRCYMGRIIGREYSVIKTIMSETETKITLSDVYKKPLQDRIIIIEGSIENMCKAEVQIRNVLRQSFTKDPHSMAPQYNINPGTPRVIPTDVNYSRDVFQIYNQTLQPVQYPPPYSSDTYIFSTPIIQSQTIMEPTNTIYLSNDFQINQQPFSPVQFQPIYSEVTDPCLNTNFYNDQAQTFIYPGLYVMDSTNINYSAPVFQVPHQPFSPVQYLPSHSNTMDPLSVTNLHIVESVCLFIPIFSIKAIVGIIGSNINDMTDVSGAKIHILPRIVENPIAPDQFCHKVNVIGTCKAQWEAQGLIFDTMWKEGYGPAPEEVILTVEISVPHNKMHYIVNEDRSLTTEMEKEMGCIIRLPIEETSNNTNYSSLHIIGGFIGTQLAQKRIRSLLAFKPGL